MTKNNNTASPHHPHDNLFKAMMERPAAARDFFKGWLPEGVKAVCNFDTLRQLPTEFIHGSEGAGVCDALFSVEKTGGDPAAGRELIYLLVEHQSTARKDMNTRMLGYIRQICLRHCKQTGDRLFPRVCPVLVYHGKKTPYPYTWTLDVYSEYADPLWAKRYLEDPVLADYTVTPDERLMAHGEAAAFEMAAKYSSMEREDNKLADFLKRYRQLKGRSPDSVLSIGLEYWLKSNRIDNDKLKDLINRLPTPVKEVIMYIADNVVDSAILRGIEQGMERGMEQGMEQGIQRVVVNLLQSGMSEGQVAEYARLDMAQVKKAAAAIREGRESGDSEEGSR